MPRSRPLTVTVIGWGLIIGYGLILIWPALNLDRLRYSLFESFHPALQLTWLISSLILLGFVSGAVQLLKLKEFGRGLVVFFAAIDIPHLVVGKAIYNNYNLQPVYIRNFLLIPLSIIIDLAIIFFLNNPKIKRCFE